MHHPTSAEAPLGDHCVCHYPDDTTHTWLIDDDEQPHDEKDAIVSYDDIKTTELYNSTTAGDISGSRETAPGSAEDAIDVPLHYTAQGDAVQALYCACFVVSETPGDDLVVSPSIKEGPTDPLFAGAVVLNHTSGDYDYIHLQDEFEFRGLTKASVVLAPQRPQQQAQVEGEMGPLPLLTRADGTPTNAGNDGALGTAFETRPGLGRGGGTATGTGLPRVSDTGSLAVEVDDNDWYFDQTNQIRRQIAINEEEFRSPGFCAPEPHQELTEEAWENINAILMDNNFLSDHGEEEEVPTPVPASPIASDIESLTVEKDENETLDWGGSKQTIPHQDPSEEKEAANEPCDYAVNVKAGGGAFYDEDDKPYSIRLLFTPDENDDDASQLPSSGWWAEMFFRCDSVPQLMKEGLHWSSENIWREEGHFSFGPIPYPWGPIARQ
ncbi:hypothetical protein PG984_008177 [Apiospora sp. TS-2023a]